MYISTYSRICRNTVYNDNRTLRNTYEISSLRAISQYFTDTFNQCSNNNRLLLRKIDQTFNTE